MRRAMPRAGSSRRTREQPIRSSAPTFSVERTETLAPPGSLRTGAGDPYSVFTAFARAFARDVKVATPLEAPRSMPPLPTDVKTKSATLPTLPSLGLERNPRVLEGGERSARERLKRWLAGDAKDYDELRNRMDLPGTSRLACHGPIPAATVAGW